MIVLFISLAPLLPMIILSQLRLALGLAVYFILLDKLKNKKNSTMKSLIAASFFHSSFIFIFIFPFFILFNVEFLEFLNKVNYHPLINRIDYYLNAGYEDRGIFSGLELMLATFAILCLAYVNKTYTVLALGIGLLISAIFDLSSWVIIRRLMELYLVIFGPYYFIIKYKMNPRTMSMFLLFLLYGLILMNNVFNYFSHDSIGVLT